MAIAHHPNLGARPMDDVRPSPPDPIEQGAQTRTHGHPKDACPSPRDSEEMTSWMEDLDGTPREDGTDMLVGESSH